MHSFQNQDTVLIQTGSIAGEPKSISLHTHLGHWRNKALGGIVGMPCPGEAWKWTMFHRKTEGYLLLFLLWDTCSVPRYPDTFIKAALIPDWATLFMISRLSFFIDYFLYYINGKIAFCDNSIPFLQFLHAVSS